MVARMRHHSLEERGLKDQQFKYAELLRTEPNTGYSGSSVSSVEEITQSGERAYFSQYTQSISPTYLSP